MKRSPSLWKNASGWALKVLGPDINESLQGFAVNKKGEIRFGLGGLKGVGEAAIKSIIEERNANGSFTNIFDFIRRINQRTVNKKSVESLVYSGAFDGFKEMHRAQYFNIPQGDTITALERIIRYGNIYQSNKSHSSNSLFGDGVMPEIAVPKITPCEEWSLTELLEHEKEVTGMFLSGHPLNHFKFELKYYGIMPVSDFNEIKDSDTLISSNLNRTFRIAGLITDAQHRITRTGKNFGAITIEDFTGKTEIMLWSEDYMRFKNYIEAGKNILVTGYYKSRYNSDQYEFKVSNLSLLETAKQTLTKQVDINMQPAAITPDFVSFVEQNIKSNPGKSSIRFNILEPQHNVKICMHMNERGFSMNEEMASFLLDNPDIDVKVEIAAN